MLDQSTSLGVKSTFKTTRLSKVYATYYWLGNEKADRLAVAAASEGPEDNIVPDFSKVVAS